MPTYTYECKKCGHTFDMFHAISADPVVKCTECDSRCRRLLGTGAGIIFKGSGFYETDYKRGNGKSGSSASSGAGKTSDAKAADSGTKSSTGDKKAAG